MTSNPTALHPDSTVAEAIDHMVTGKYGCIPVVDGEKRLVGIVTETDVLKLVARHLY
jgi:CBS domain-containing protein